MAVRQFSLLNEKGQEFSLMDIQKYCFLSSPTGLGINFQSDYEQMGNTFVESIRKVAQGKIPGSLYVLNYDKYREFSDFIFGSEKLRFKYIVPYTNNEKTFYKDVKLISLSKTELDHKLGVLASQVSFDCLTLWYETNTVNYSYDDSENALIWDFVWDSYFVDYGNRDIEFLNEGQTDSAIELEIDGEFEDLNIQLYIENELYQEIPINVRVENFEKLFYSSKENEFEISKILSDGTKQSLFTLDNIDFSKDNVIRIPNNKSCKITLDSETDITSAKLLVYIYYLTV